MWQRIQTLWLLLAGVAMTLLLFFPMGMGSASDGGYEFLTIGARKIGGGITDPTWGLFFVDLLSVLLSFVTIFLYKKRVLQIRLSVVNALVIVGMLIYYAMLTYNFLSVHNLSYGFKFWFAMPIISIVFLYLAIRNIGADEAKVRALDRLR
ncbi:MAG: DUF4293 domain-containing protein [Porphyromonadaceae bacterium]|nr:DUF4293 domain-containing protein [Porphyromonadaceae bacterium]